MERPVRIHFFVSFPSHVVAILVIFCIENVCCRWCIYTYYVFINCLFRDGTDGISLFDIKLISVFWSVSTVGIDCMSSFVVCDIYYPKDPSIETDQSSCFSKVHIIVSLHMRQWNTSRASFETSSGSRNQI